MITGKGKIMAENSGEISTVMVTGIGIVIFLVIAGALYLFLR